MMQEEGRAGKAFRQRVSHIECTSTLHQREHCVPHQVPDEVPTDIDVSRELAVHLVVGDRDAGRVVLPDDSWGLLLIPKSSKHRSEVHHLLAAHASSYIFRLR
eukprot:3941141-Rhodomonas_salina.1